MVKEGNLVTVSKQKRFFCSNISFYPVSDSNWILSLSIWWSAKGELKCIQTLCWPCEACVSFVIQAHVKRGRREPSSLSQHLNSPLKAESGPDMELIQITPSVVTWQYLGERDVLYLPLCDYWIELKEGNTISTKSWKTTTLKNDNRGKFLQMKSTNDSTESGWVESTVRETRPASMCGSVKAAVGHQPNNIRTHLEITGRTNRARIKCTTCLLWSNLLLSSQPQRGRGDWTNSFLHPQHS